MTHLQTSPTLQQIVINQVVVNPKNHGERYGGQCGSADDTTDGGRTMVLRRGPLPMGAEIKAELTTVGRTVTGEFTLGPWALPDRAPPPQAAPIHVAVPEAPVSADPAPESSSRSAPASASAPTFPGQSLPAPESAHAP